MMAVTTRFAGPFLFSLFFIFRPVLSFLFPFSFLVSRPRIAFSAFARPRSRPPPPPLLLTRPGGVLGSVHESINVRGEWWKWTRRGGRTDDREIVENRMVEGWKVREGGDEGRRQFVASRDWRLFVQPVFLSLPLPRWYQGPMEICQPEVVETGSRRCLLMDSCKRSERALLYLLDEGKCDRRCVLFRRFVEMAVVGNDGIWLKGALWLL